MELLIGERFTVASWGAPAAFTAWLLQSFGAEVEHTTALDPEGLGAFLGEGAAFAGKPALRVAAGGTLITDAPVTPENRARLEQLADEATVVWLNPWGLGSEWAERPATGLCLHAAGGWMKAVGEPDREPLGPPGAQGGFIAGIFAAVAALAPLVFGERTPGLVSVPIVEAVAATCIYDAVAFQYHGTTRERAGRRFARPQSTLVTLPCKDGHVGVHAALHAQFVRLAELVGRPEILADPRFADPLERMLNVDALDAYWCEWLATRTRFEAYHELQAAAIPGSPLPTLAEVLDSPQLAARRFWKTAKTPSGRQLRVPGPTARVTGTAGPASVLPDGPWAPDKLRVVDLSMGWAGPFVSFILASFGADVIKLESHNRFDWWRGSRPPGDDPGLALHEHSHVFNSTNRGKRGLTLDLQTPEGNALGRRLIASADVVVENFGAGVLEKLGLGYEVLSEDNPGLILLRQPGFGAGGPESGYRVFGNTIEGMSGLTELMGYEDGPPQMMANALGDPVSGLNGTVAVLAAVRARARDGRGRCIEAAQLEGFLPLVSEELIAYERSGELPQRRGNRRPGHEPSGVYRCAGEDDWVAIDVTDDRAWAALAAVTGWAWAGDPALATADGRAAERERIAAALTEWTSSRARDGVAAELSMAGVAAAPVNGEADVLSSPLVGGAGFFEGQERAHVGFHLYPLLPIVTAGERIPSPPPAPTLGEHNTQILTGLGIPADAIEELRDRRVIGERPD
ncbi:MAG: CoA transferase [Chloroflexi bacterium]|nr:CoA transferase [Chloroflexota bacterium]